MQIQQWLNCSDVMLPKISDLSIIYGFDIEKNRKWYLVSHLICLFKQYIFNSREAGVVTLQGYINILTDTENIERKIAGKRDKQAIHYRKWEPILNVLKNGHTME